ncbi:MAG: hypothetical protein HQ592_13735, partial [Planctomycetes bacterium]|nr:hypothetical protein [Planctomycetota bacterium]
KSIGIRIIGDSAPTLVSNDFLGNTDYGVENNNMSVTIQARGNNWDYSSGPYDPSDDRATGGLYNPNGQGDRVTDGVDYSDWELDLQPPAPNPMTWSAAPYASDQGSISMRAAAATDSTTPPVSYCFVGTSGSNSGWQPVADFTDAGLSPNTHYSYSVTARDSANTPNETEPSTEQGAYTLANIPGAPPVEVVALTSIEIVIDPNANPDHTEFAVRCTNLGTYATAAGDPAPDPMWLPLLQWNGRARFNNLPPGDQSFVVLARNGDSIETPPSPQSDPKRTSVPGDTNFDCVVNVLDMLLVRSMLSDDTTTGDNWRADLNNDGNINVLDMLVVRGALGSACGI